MLNQGRTKILLSLLILLYVIYGWVFIQQTSITFQGVKYYTLFDDAMISMRYAKNLANGHGLVWNPGGEKVEGYTNFLWVLYMAVPHILRLPDSKTSLFIQLSAMMLMIASMILLYKTAMLLSGGDEDVSLGTLVMTGLFFPATYWSLTGMETGPLIFLLAAAVYLCGVNIKSGKFSLLLYPVLGLMTLVRIDMYLLYAFIALFMYISDRANAGRHLAYGAGIFVLSLAGMTIFRVLYYNDPLPNTYYLKMTGYPLFWRVMHGIMVSLTTILKEGIVPFVIAFAGVVLVKKREYALIAGIFCVQFLYSVFTGGDAWETAVTANRYITTAMPVFFVLVAAGFKDIILKAGKKFNLKRDLYWPGIMLMVVLLNCGRGIQGYKELLLVEPAAHAVHGRSVIAKSFIMEKLAGKNAVIGIFMAGKIPYFLDRTYIDFLGKNDRHIARLPAIQPGDELNFMQKADFFIPGHMKVDYSYAIASKKPDIIDDIYWPEKLGQDAKKVLDTDYMEFIMGIKLLKNSPNVNWDNYKDIIKQLNSGK